LGIDKTLAGEASPPLPDMPVRVHLPLSLHEGAELTLPPEPSRHIQVLRLQPGDEVTVFTGEGGEWDATVTRMGRQDVDLHIGAHRAVDRELGRHVTMALGMPANERMDTLVEKATELGVAVIQPLICARSVLRLNGDRAEKRRAHWQGVAEAAAEQSGRTRVPVVHPIGSIDAWLGSLPAATQDPTQRLLLSFAPGAWSPAQLLQSPQQVCLLSGPEGGLDPREEALAREAGFSALSLGTRVLRADTAPLAALSLLSVEMGAR
jgi:16S rRNA (uracil1498-N3)-methyltransferase